jgi:hypothetical protein
MPRPFGPAEGAASRPRAGPTPSRGHARKPVDDQTAAQKGAEFPFDETGQAHAVGTRSRFRQERLHGG